MELFCSCYYERLLLLIKDFCCINIFSLRLNCSDNSVISTSFSLILSFYRPISYYFSTFKLYISPEDSKFAKYNYVLLGSPLLFIFYWIIFLLSCNVLNLLERSCIYYCSDYAPCEFIDCCSLYYCD